MMLSRAVVKVVFQNKSCGGNVFQSWGSGFVLNWDTAETQHSDVLCDAHQFFLKVSN